jgi:hypothetical protein
MRGLGHRVKHPGQYGANRKDADLAQSWHAQITMDQDPIADGIDHVAPDPSEHDRLNQTHTLQVAANGGIEEQRESPLSQHPEEAYGLNPDRRMDTQAVQPGDAASE